MLSFEFGRSIKEDNLRDKLDGFLEFCRTNKGTMSVGEAGQKIGKKGGETVSDKYDQEHFQEIGQKGGETTSQNHGEEFYEEIGEKGGKERYPAKTTPTVNSCNMILKNGELYPFK